MVKNIQLGLIRYIIVPIQVWGGGFAKRESYNFQTITTTHPLTRKGIERHIEGFMIKLKVIESYKVREIMFIRYMMSIMN